MILLTNNEGTVGAPTTARPPGGRPGRAGRDRGRHQADRGRPHRAHRRARRLAQPAGRGRAGRLPDARHHAAHRRGRRAEGLPAPGQRRARGDAPPAARAAGGRGRRPLRPRDRRRTGREPDPGFATCLAGLVRRRADARAKARLARHPAGRAVPHAIDPEIGRDTTVFLAQDATGAICSGTSTSGWGWKYPGRLGDSPIIGAGSYADTRYGAAACTGAGEMTIRCGTARSIVLYMKKGASVDDAVHEAVDDMRAPARRADQPRDHPRHRRQGQPQGRRGERRRRQRLLAVAKRRGGTGVIARRTDRHHQRREQADGRCPLRPVIRPVTRGVSHRAD